MLRPEAHRRSGLGTFLVPSCWTPSIFTSTETARCTFIEPYPAKLLSLLRPEDLRRVTILEKRVQDVDLDPFLALERSDILFIDSSHVVKIGSDVNFLLGK